MSPNQISWTDSGQILHHQYVISVAETLTSLLVKRPWWWRGLVFSGELMEMELLENIERMEIILWNHYNDNGWRSSGGERIVLDVLHFWGSTYPLSSFISTGVEEVFTYSSKINLMYYFFIASRISIHWRSESNELLPFNPSVIWSNLNKITKEQ